METGFTPATPITVKNAKITSANTNVNGKIVSIVTMVAVNPIVTPKSAKYVTQIHGIVNTNVIFIRSAATKVRANRLAFVMSPVNAKAPGIIVTDGLNQVVLVEIFS
ncbi:MAG: hypothetical protein JW749_05680 [Sedimentisphaerales bacterium]|nr:hypothetical protein [Sedimentisphaerales bacterium]